ncbi:MAG: NAD-dependent protein deacylase [Lachnospiraceae bacterium]|nr:NAD-dependent protein deacylase [Lachnospiraceae bacterium]
MSDNTQFETLVNYISESDNIVFFGGAGVSTESGIPDFRSKDGLYNQRDVQFEKYSPEYLLSHSCLRDNPKVFFEFYRQKLDTRGIEPNVAHKVIAKLEDMGKINGVVTQNIDGLHQLAGSKKVYEIHGTTHINYCMDCKRDMGEYYIFDAQKDGHLDEDGIPRCDKCGGVVRPYVTLYEEGLPDDAVNAAVNAISTADMIIIAGTSLNVYPAASYIRYFRGKHIVVLNRDKIGVDLNPETDMFIQGNMGDAFRYVDEAISAGRLS